MPARKARWREPMQLDLLGGPAVPASLTPAYDPLARRPAQASTTKSIAGADDLAPALPFPSITGA